MQQQQQKGPFQQWLKKVSVNSHKERTDKFGSKEIYNFCPLFYLVFEGKFQVQAPWRAYIRRGDLTDGFLRPDFGGLIHGGAYFRKFTLSPFEYKPSKSKPLKKGLWKI